MRRAVILHSSVDASLLDSAHSDEADTIVQVEEISKVLTELGYICEALPFTCDLNGIARVLRQKLPNIAFNLVESVDGSSRDIFLAPLLLEMLGIPFTGCPSSALYLTTDKVIAKRLMISGEISTPSWVSLSDSWGEFLSHEKYLIKPRAEDASIGISQKGVVEVSTREELLSCIQRSETECCCPCFAEQFIPSREFNVSVIGAHDSPEILPIAEINYTRYFDDKHKIIDYSAKWDTSTLEYQESLPYFPILDAKLERELMDSTLKCWDIFQLSGYARVDFRVSARGTPYVIEVNADPGISPGAGFVLACEKKGIAYKEMIERIVSVSVPRQFTK